ncbi:MAG TPA: hypothetical protein DCO77_13150 [Nitrospiraceae bacterium]|nr:hypothetical protein [Nitrospiraceae bacterium]
MVSLDAILVKMPDEMLNDAKWYLMQAEEHAASGATFQLWREVRATAIFSLASIESFINWVAHGYRNQLKHNPEKKEDLSKIEKLISRERNFTLKKKLIKYARTITGNDFDKNMIWDEFDELIDFRNTLVHYKPSVDVYAKSTIEMARKYVKCAQMIIERFYYNWGQPVQPWVNAPYREIR